MDSTTKSGEPTTEQIASGYTAARSEAAANLTRVTVVVGSVVLAWIFISTVWTALSPQPNPMIGWLEASSSQAISGAFTGISVAVAGLIAIGHWVARTTLRRAFDGARPMWARLLFAALFVTALFTDLAPDPTLYLGGLVGVLMLLGWVDDRIQEDRQLALTPTVPEREDPDHD